MLTTPHRAQSIASPSSSFVSAREDQLPSPATNHEDEGDMNSNESILGEPPTLSDLDTFSHRTSNNESEENAFVSSLRLQFTPITNDQVLKLLEQKTDTIKKLREALQSSLDECEAQDRDIERLANEILSARAELHELRLKNRRNEANIMALQKQLETKCDSIDGSHMRLPCYNLVCTHASNNQYDDEEVLRAIGREGVERERLLKLRVNQGMAALDWRLDGSCRLPDKLSLSKQSLIGPWNHSDTDVPIPELILGEPLLAPPETLLTPKVSAVVLRPVNKNLPVAHDEFGSLLEPSVQNPIIVARKDSKAVPMLPKATPMSAGYFQDPKYLEGVRKEVRNIVDGHQKQPKGTIKKKLEKFSASLHQQSNLVSPVSQTEHLAVGRELNAVDIQRAQERFNAYAPAWEDQDTLMKPILNLAKVPFMRSKNLSSIEDSPCSLGAPAIPIPLSLVVSELLNKVEQDGQILQGAKEYVRETNVWKQDALFRQELDDCQIKSLEHQVSLLKREQGGRGMEGSIETASQKLEQLRQDNDRLRRGEDI